MANLATKASVEGRIRFKIRAPLISMRKSEIIKTGLERGLDYSLTWSCYDPQPKEGKKAKGKLKSYKEEFIPCGRCDSCIFRAKGFEEAGIKDPLSSQGQ
jgi:7-cyano-7-deazaguanine synthase